MATQAIGIEFQGYGQLVEALEFHRWPQVWQLNMPVGSGIDWEHLREALKVNEGRLYDLSATHEGSQGVPVLRLVRQPTPDLLTITACTAVCATYVDAADQIGQQRPRVLILRWPVHYTLYWGAMRTHLRGRYHLEYKIVEMLEHGPDWESRLVRRIDRKPDPDLF